MGWSMTNNKGSRTLAGSPRATELKVRMTQGQETYVNGDSKYPRFSIHEDRVAYYVGGSDVDMDVCLDHRSIRKMLVSVEREINCLLVKLRGA